MVEQSFQGLQDGWQNGVMGDLVPYVDQSFLDGYDWDEKPQPNEVPLSRLATSRLVENRHGATTSRHVENEQQALQVWSKFQHDHVEEFPSSHLYFDQVAASSYTRQPFDRSASSRIPAPKLAPHERAQAHGFVGYPDRRSLHQQQQQFAPPGYMGRAGRGNSSDISRQIAPRAKSSVDSGYPPFEAHHPQRVDLTMEEFDDETQEDYDELSEFQGSSVPEPLADSSYKLKTTLMIRNIPLVYNQEMLLVDWPNINTYDFLYLPCITYAFVNFTSEAGALDFIRRWQQLRLPRGRSKKPLNISFAVVQGLANNLKRWKRKRTWRLSNRSKPFVFRNGVQLALEELMHCV